MSTISLGELTKIIEAADEMKEVFGVVENTSFMADRMQATATVLKDRLLKFCLAYNKLQDNVRGLKMVEFNLVNKEK